METKHTPAPWKANGLHISSVGKTSDIGQAFVKHNYDMQTGKKVTDFEALANARLMASAPELLEALVWIEHHALQDGCEKRALKSVALMAIKKLKVV